MTEQATPGAASLDSPAILPLQTADSHVTICPALGGTLARFTWRGHDILRPAPGTAMRERQVRQMACYPLVPYSNRIGHAQLMADGQQHRLRANAPPEAHALHGFGWQHVWKVVAQAETVAELFLQHAADDDWPFACEVRQKIRLVENALHLQLSARNTDDRPMPVGLGFHPYFPTPDGTCLQASWKNMWAMGADSLPTALIAVPPAADFSRSRPLDGWKVDNCFTGWDRHAVLDYPTHRVRLDASDACRQIVCFAPGDGRQFIALEPVTNINNAFALAASGVAATGMKMLAPGESFEIDVTITVGERPTGNG